MVYVIKTDCFSVSSISTLCEILTSALPSDIFKAHKLELFAFAVEHRRLQSGQVIIVLPGFSHLLTFPEVFSLMSNRAACVFKCEYENTLQLTVLPEKDLT